MTTLTDLSATSHFELARSGRRPPSRVSATFYYILLAEALMAQDRTRSDVLFFTQEFLAMMIGARRTTVTVIAGALQRSGLIEYERGTVKILNRSDLEAAACNCYQITKNLYAGLYSKPAPGMVQLDQGS